MADDAQDGSPKSPKTEPSHVETSEDAETRAARRELKQSSISDGPRPAPDGTAATDDSAADRPATPADAQSDDLRDQVASPKKKRAHDQLDGDKEADDDVDSEASSDSAKDRSTRLEPEKKRHRDEESKAAASKSTTETRATTTTTESTPAAESKDEPSKPPSAFAASSFGKLSAGASPFASLSGSQGSVFGAGAPKLTSFASPTPPAEKPSGPPKLSFGGASSVSPFAGLSSGANGFGGSALGGSAFGGSAFGSALGGVKPLGSFAASSAAPAKSEKPAKPFGAPDSDADSEDEDDEGDEEAQSKEPERALSPEKESDEKKKLRLQKIQVDDGEAGETTMLSVRAKIFHHDKEAGWKERGAGMLKINVPEACVEFDDAGVVIPGSFDASGLEADDEEGGDGVPVRKVVRLIMRQDQTHRVLLNTAIFPAMKFQEKTSLKSVGILFTAFEGDEAKPVSITMRMSAANAKSFMNELSVIQRELQNS